MKIFYTLITYIYYALTIFVGIFFLRGEFLFGTVYTLLLELLIPGYLVLSGIMVGYVGANIITLNDTKEHTQRVWMQSFVVGLLFGLLLALLYIFIR